MGSVRRNGLEAGRASAQGLSDKRITVDKDGCFWPIDKPGLGVEMDENFLTAHPFIDGPSYAGS
jgi:D-galactarolactone cycloisomerase